MTQNEKLLFTIVASQGVVISEILRVQAETNRTLADKLPNVSGVAQAALRENATELDKKATNYSAAAKKLSDSIQK